MKTAVLTKFLILTAPVPIPLTYQHRNKVDRKCTTTNLSASKNVKIISIFDCLHGEVVSINSTVQKRDGQTKNIKNPNRICLSLGDVKSPSRTKLGMVIEEVRMVSAPLKRLASDE